MEVRPKLNSLPKNKKTKKKKKKELKTLRLSVLKEWVKNNEMTLRRKEQL